MTHPFEAQGRETAGQVRCGTGGGQASGATDTPAAAVGRWQHSHRGSSGSRKERSAVVVVSDE